MLQFKRGIILVENFSQLLEESLVDFKYKEGNNQGNRPFNRK